MWHGMSFDKMCGDVKERRGNCNANITYLDMKKIFDMLLSC
jgi:hypothetical protein